MRGISRRTIRFVRISFVYPDARGPKQPIGWSGATVSGVSTPMSLTGVLLPCVSTVMVSPSVTFVTVP